MGTNNLKVNRMKISILSNLGTAGFIINESARTYIVQFNNTKENQRFWKKSLVNTKHKEFTSIELIDTMKNVKIPSTSGFNDDINAKYGISIDPTKDYRNMKQSLNALLRELIEVPNDATITITIKDNLATFEGYNTKFLTELHVSSDVKSIMKTTKATLLKCPKRYKPAELSIKGDYLVNFENIISESSK